MKHFFRAFAGLLIAPIAFAFVAENASEGLGVETLMGGVGQARIGSLGSLSSNPALLSSLPEKAQFISTNAINFYKFKSSSESSMDVTPEITPRLAANTEGFGNWGHSYGLVINKLKVSLDAREDGNNSVGTSETLAINLNYAFGYKLSATSSFGFGIYVGRIQEDSTFSSIGESSGFEYSFIIRDKQSFWVQGISLGYVTSITNWDFGISSKILTSKFGATGRSEQNGYSEAEGTNLELGDHKVNPSKVLPNIRAGLQKRFESLRLFFDLSYVPSYTDPDFNDYQKSKLQGVLGLEAQLNERYNWYSGLRYDPYVDKETKAAGTLSAGLSKVGQHSLNFAGVAWSRGIESAENSLVQVNFGTEFDY